MKNSANINGKYYEVLTDSFNRLLKLNFDKNKIVIKPKFNYHYLLRKEYNDKLIEFSHQSGFKKFVKEKYNIDLFRNPDEAFIINRTTKTKIVIVEKKFQIVTGSCDIKLWASPTLKKEYEILFKDLKNVQIEYVLSVNNWLMNKINSDATKYKILLEILKKENIIVLCGDHNNYFKQLDKIVFKNF